MKKHTVGIIGIDGKYGQWLKFFFERLGHRVIGSDVMADVTSRQVVEQADVVIFSVPISVVVSVINEVAEFSREGQLFMDITSLKGPAVDAMMKSVANVVGLHPMCAPPKEGGTLRGQVIVRCDARLSDEWKVWVDEFMVATSATIKGSTPFEHDKNMAVVQALPHAIQLVMARVICKLGVDVPESMSYTSPFYKITFGLMGRILSKDSAMYASIQMENPHVSKVIETLKDELERFSSIVGLENKVHRSQAFDDDFKSSQKHFGKEPIAKADKFFDDIIGLMADLSEENMFVLEAEIDRPGLAHVVTGIFAEEMVNLTSFHSKKVSGGRIRFMVGFDGRKESPEIKAVELKLRGLDYLKVVS